MIKWRDPITSVGFESGARAAAFEDRPPRTSRASYGRSFTVMFHGSFPWVVVQIQSKAALRLLPCLPAYLSPDHWLPLKQERIADDLKMTLNDVNRGLHELLRLKVIARKGAGPAIQWKLTSNHYARGTPNEYHAERRAEIRLGYVDPGRSPPDIVAEDILRDQSAPRTAQRSVRVLRPRQVEACPVTPAGSRNGNAGQECPCPASRGECDEHASQAPAVDRGDPGREGQDRHCEAVGTMPSRGNSLGGISPGSRRSESGVTSGSL